MSIRRRILYLGRNYVLSKKEEKLTPYPFQQLSFHTLKAVKMLNAGRRSLKDVIH